MGGGGVVCCLAVGGLWPAVPGSQDWAFSIPFLIRVAAYVLSHGG